MMSVGFFHADPHQGNFIRRASDGRLAYIDFGMCARIDDATRRALLTASVHLASREFGSLADDMLALGFFPPGTQRSVVAPALTGVFARAMEGGVQALSFQELSADLGKTMYDYKFRLPTYATLLVRSLTTLEGIARSADREYPGLLQSAYPWIARRLLQSPLVQVAVAIAAAQGLSLLDDLRCFSRLVDALEHASGRGEPKLVVEIERTLASVSRDSKKRAPTQWRSWWEANQKRLQAERS
jgi:predicted unusual protein kinase regulating ubiquinone biosynthesis (AarF/ABC1/UbiB family)